MIDERTFRSTILTLVLMSISGVAGAQVRPSRTGEAPGAVKPCAEGTVASYLGTSCSQGAAVTRWLSYSCTSTPASICEALGTNGSNVIIKMDPEGPYTIFVGCTTLWNVTAGQKVDVLIGGTVYGARQHENWPHFKDGPDGQTGDGTETNITTVYCGDKCLDANKGVSEVPCSSTSPVANCRQQHKWGPYASHRANFKPATSDNPYLFTVEIKLDGGKTGTAALHQVGLHLSPKP